MQHRASLSWRLKKNGAKSAFKIPLSKLNESNLLRNINSHAHNKSDNNDNEMQLSRQYKMYPYSKQ